MLFSTVAATISHFFLCCTQGYIDVWIPLEARCFRTSLSVPYQLKLGVL